MSRSTLSKRNLTCPTPYNTRVEVNAMSSTSFCFMVCAIVNTLGVLLKLRLAKLPVNLVLREGALTKLR